MGKASEECFDTFQILGTADYRRGATGLEVRNKELFVATYRLYYRDVADSCMEVYYDNGRNNYICNLTYFDFHI